MNETVFRTLIRAWAVITVVDGIFATLLPVVAFGEPIGQVWKVVASVLLGRGAVQGGSATLLFGLVMHASVAFVWTSVFMALAVLSPRLRRILATPTGIVLVAALYGPAIWIVMSLLVIPRFTGRTPSIGDRWWIQLFAHIAFVAQPIVGTIARGLRPADAVAHARPAVDAV